MALNTYLSQSVSTIKIGFNLQTGYLDIWEPATLAIKKEGYSIKCSGPSGVVVSEKFSPSISVRLLLFIVHNSLVNWKSELMIHIGKWTNSKSHIMQHFPSAPSHFYTLI